MHPGYPQQQGKEPHRGRLSQVLEDDIQHGCGADAQLLTTMLRADPNYVVHITASLAAQEAAPNRALA